MSTIFERIENKLETLENKATKKAIKELKYQRLTEQFRGAKWHDKAEAIMKILQA